MRLALIASLGLPAVALVAAMAYVRLAPAPPARFHIDLAQNRPADMPPAPRPPGADAVQTLPRGAYADLILPPEAAWLALSQLETIAAATPRTTVFAGSRAKGHITWETRSHIFGFPDYTTAQITPDGLALAARLRFGRSDLGVNAARLRDWLSRLPPP